MKNNRRILLPVATGLSLIACSPSEDNINPNNNNNNSLGYVKFVIQFSKPIIWILLAFRGTLLYMSRVKEVSYFENVKGNIFDVIKVRLVSIMEINEFSSDCVDGCCFVFS